ncbi:hypothetical protein MMC14_007501 [Varicellaria rhodocarpa]|nr:hypothetical protein [Varicellaria rhodocarpa]
MTDAISTVQGQGSNGYTGWSYASNHATEAQDWTQEILTASERDVRKQPWKQTFGDTVDCRFDDGEDLMTVKGSPGGMPDPHCPFRTQGSSLAA